MEISASLKSFCFFVGIAGSQLQRSRHRDGFLTLWQHDRYRGGLEGGRYLLAQTPPHWVRTQGPKQHRSRNPRTYAANNKQTRANAAAAIVQKTASLPTVKLSINVSCPAQCATKLQVQKTAKASASHAGNIFSCANAFCAVSQALRFYPTTYVYI